MGRKHTLETVDALIWFDTRYVAGERRGQGHQEYRATAAYRAGDGGGEVRLVAGLGWKPTRGLAAGEVRRLLGDRTSRVCSRHEVARESRRRGWEIALEEVQTAQAPV